MFREECNSLAAILSELAVARERDNELLSPLTRLFTAPSPDMPPISPRSALKLSSFSGKMPLHCCPNWPESGEVTTVFPA